MFTSFSMLLHISLSVTCCGCWTKLAIQANEVKDRRCPLKICDGGRKLLYIYNHV